ncbi:MAG: hypothetical protein ABI847_05805 [Anaerolineales bacterium]
MPITTSNTSRSKFLNSFLFFLLGLGLLVATAAHAQADELTLSVHRIFGYDGFSQIQGNFRLEAAGPATLTSVTFKIDATIVAKVSQSPFRVDFVTDNYPLGWHDLTATGQTSDGRALTSAPRRFEFVSASQGWQAVGKILVPLLIVVGLALVIGLGVPLVQAFRGKPAPVAPGTPRRYGLMGGAICPKCHRPFARHWWGLNAGLGKFDRCDNCGKWSVVRAAPLDKLRAAEAAEIEHTVAAPDLSPEEKLRRQLDDSKYRDAG